MEKDYYLGLDMGSASVGWQLRMINTIFCVHMEKLCGEPGCLSLQIQLKIEESIVQLEED